MKLSNENLMKKFIFDLTGYVPHDKQANIHYSDARFRVAICGRRFGKSLLAAKEGNSILLDKTQENKRIWIVAPHHETTDKVFREVWNDMVIKRYISANDIVKKSWTEQNRIIRTSWGSEIIGKTARNEDSLIGEEVDLLIFDEAAKTKEKTWTKYLNPTLLDRKGRALFITTPEGNNWVYDIYKMGISDEFPDWQSFHYTSYDRPQHTLRTSSDPYNIIKAKELIEYIDNRKKELSEELFRQEYLADFHTYHGQVFKDFDVTVHVINKRDLPRFDLVIAGVDYGYVNPTAIIIIGIKDKRYYVIHETYKTEMTLDDITAELKRLKNLYKFKYLYAEHKPEYNKPLTRRGIPVTNAKKDVTAGIERVASKMKIRKDDKPSFFILDTCHNTISEHEGYSYAETKENRNTKEEPVKDRDHTCDAVRYAIFTHETGYKGITVSRTSGLYG